MINYYGLRQINTRGREAAAKVMYVAAIAYNLKKYLRFTPVEQGGMVMALPAPDQFYFTLIYFCDSHSTHGTPPCPQSMIAFRQRVLPEPAYKVVEYVRGELAILSSESAQLLGHDSYVLVGKHFFFTNYSIWADSLARLAAKQDRPARAISNLAI